MASKKTAKKGIFKPLAAAFLEADPEDDDFEIHTPTVQHTRQSYRPIEPIRSLTELTKEETRVMLREQLVSRTSAETPKKGEKPEKTEKVTEEKPVAEKTKTEVGTKKEKSAAAESEKEGKPAAKKAPAKAPAKAAVSEKAEKTKETSDRNSAKSTSSKPAAKKTAPEEPVKEESAAAGGTAELHIEYQGRSYDRQELVERAVTIWVKKLRRGRNNLNSLELYVKPQEQMVYYVFNKTRSGSFPL